MRKNIRLISLALLVLFLCSFSTAFAAPASNLATLKLRVEVPDKDFWNCTYFTKESDRPAKPSVVKAEWSFGNLGRNPKSEVIVPTGKLSGEIDIISEKGSIVNLDIFVKDGKNVTVGAWGMQLINKGQTETVTIFLPEEVRPVITRSDV